MEATTPLVLVADYSETIRTTAVSILTHHGYLAFGAANPEEVGDVLVNDAAVVILDADMAERIRTAYGSRLRGERIVLSDDCEQAARMPLMAELGCRCYLQKPYTALALLRAVASVLRAGARGPWMCQTPETTPLRQRSGPSEARTRRPPEPAGAAG